MNIESPYKIKHFFTKKQKHFKKKKSFLGYSKGHLKLETRDPSSG